MKYWITHPNLGPSHDEEIEALALPDRIRGGWQIREDQAAAPIDFTPADPRESTDENTPEPRPTTSRIKTDDTKGEV